MSVKMPFGKYKDQCLKEIPSSYLEWAQANVNFYNKSLKQEIEYELLERMSQEDELLKYSIDPTVLNDEDLKFKFSIGYFY